MAPLALAFERYLECELFLNKTFVHPILDLGCGDGLFSYILFDEKIDTGIDLNNDELACAKKLQCYDELICCPGDKIPKPDGLYQTIFSNSVLEHIDTLEPVFKEVYRLLSTNGRLYLTIPSIDFEQYTTINQLLLKIGFSQVASRYQKFCSKIIWRQSHYHTIKEWESIVSTFGFEVVDSFTYDKKRICLLNNFLYPFGILGLMNKRFLKRWVWVPAIRRIVIFPLYSISKQILNNDEHQTNGGLVFLELKKVKNQ
jgi:SAM-dependent methyltransferase